MSIIIERRRARTKVRRETEDGRREEVLTFKFCPKCNCVPAGGGGAKRRGWTGNQQ